MSTRKVFCVILTLSVFLGLCHVATAKSVPIDAEMASQQVQEENDLKELKNQIRREKFDLILPQVMRKHKIDMWIYVMREVLPDGFGADLGSASGVFIFTDRGGDRIERAVLGRRWRGSDHKLVEECGAYDIIGEAVFRRELPGRPETEYDYRFKGIGEFVAERDPQRIGVNYKEKLGPPEAERTIDGISHTDYILLSKALGEKYARRMVSAEYLLMDYLARPVPSEIKMLTINRKIVDEGLKKDFAKIIPGVTKLGDIEDVSIMVPEKGVLTNRSNPDYVFQRGDLFTIGQGDHANSDWKQGNFFEIKQEYGYVLRDGETELPPILKKLWAEGLKIRKVLDDNIKVGRTAGETYEILNQKLAEVGIISNDRQQYYKDLDPEKTQVALDLHAIGKGPLVPRIGPLGPDWQRDMTLPVNHHFVIEFFMYMPLPHAKHEVSYLSLWFHDGAIVTERGVEYLTPPPTEIRLLK